MRSISSISYDFSRNPLVKCPRSVFDRSHGYKNAIGCDYLHPFYVDEILPGDSFKLRAQFLLRFNDLLCPFMDNLRISTYYFYVPSRLVWDNFKKFMGEQKNPGDSTDYTIPAIKLAKTDLTPTSIYSDLGIPLANQLATNKYYYINALPLRAYYMIWNEWFRDENLQDSLEYRTDDQQVNGTAFSLKKVGKKHDYLTSCLPWPQKGPAVSMNLAWTAPYVQGRTTNATHAIATGKALGLTTGSAGSMRVLAEDSNYRVGTSDVTYALSSLPNTGTSVPQGTGGGAAPGKALGFEANTSLDSIFQVEFTPGAVDWSGLSFTINQLRQAAAVQQLYEINARSGTRYCEMVYGHYGVLTDDLTLGRPLFLGGSRSFINVTQVPQTSASTEASKQGNLAAYSVTSASSGFTHFFNEHGYVIGLMAITADLNYQQGIDKMWSKRKMLDIYFPALAHIGEQPVLNREIYAQGQANPIATISDDDDKVFGYQEYGIEYRTKRSIITGELSSMSPQSLQQWHLAQKFNNLPTLSSQFIESDTPIDRVRAVYGHPPFLLDAFLNLKCARPLPVRSIPGLKRF